MSQGYSVTFTFPVTATTPTTLNNCVEHLGANGQVLATFVHGGTGNLVDLDLSLTNCSICDKFRRHTDNDELQTG